VSALYAAITIAQIYDVNNCAAACVIVVRSSPEGELRRDVV